MNNSNKTETDIDTKNKLMVAQGGGGEEVKGIQKYKIPVIK